MAKILVFENEKEIASLVLEPSKEFSVGRSPENDLCLNAENISRQHFKISFENNKWVVRLSARYGEILYKNLPQKSFELNEFDSFSIPPFTFKFFANQDSKTSLPTIPLYKNSEDTFDHSSTDEKTQSGVYHGIPYLTIVSPHAGSDTLRLEGDYWIIGRDPKNEIYIEDSKSSRKHAEISRTGQDFTIKDLNSSNGMFFNNQKMTANLPLPLMSGDEFSIGSTHFHFEIRDPHFDEKVKNLPTEYVSFTPHTAPPSGGGGGAIRLPPAPIYKRPAVIGIATVVLLALIFGTGKDEKPKNENTSLSSKDKETAKSQLTPEQKEFVERTYRLAKTLYMQNKYSLALVEIEKVHQYIDSYEDSRQIEQLSKEGVEAENQLRQLAADEQRQQETQEKIKAIIIDCEAQFYSLKLNPDGVRSCLQMATELDPGNAEAEALIAKAEEAQRQKELKLQNQAAYNQRVLSTRTQYAQAKKLYSSGKLKEAREAYSRFISSTSPDPDGLKPKAKSELDNVKQELSAKVNTYKREAEAFKSQDKIKEAILSLRKARELDPKDSSVKETESQFTAELRKQMMALYSESVIEENLGNIESAKEKWLKIRQLDIPNGEYFKKSKIKLKKYGL